MIKQIDYKKTYKYWNRSSGQVKARPYSSGYLIPAELENIAYYRFKKELEFLNTFGKFGGKYLDIGCGTGNFLYEWRNKFDLLVGIDFSKPLTKIAKERCKRFRHIKIFTGNVLNFEKYLNKNDKFKFIFIGGCLMYLNDEDTSGLLKKLYLHLQNDGVLIFREPTVSEKRIYENQKNYTGIRRTIEEYKNLARLNGKVCALNHYQNYAYDYAFIISFYCKAFPFLNNKIRIFENAIIEFLLLFVPLKIYTLLKGNMILSHFLLIEKR